MTPALPLLTAQQAILFVSESASADATGAAQQLLANTLLRLLVRAEQQRIVALQTQPLLGREHHVRVTPCLLLDTGTRQVQLLGPLEQLGDSSLQQALARP